MEVAPGIEVPFTAEVWATVDPSVKAFIISMLTRLRDVEARLNQNSSNSSKPPSSDPPWGKPIRKKKPKSGRRPGGQPGHPPHLRKMLTPEKVNVVVDYRPEQCGHCGHTFVDDLDPTLEPRIHQVVDLPEIDPRVEEHRLHARCCSVCKKETRSRLPKHVPLNSFGPRLQAWIAVLTVRFRLSKREARELLKGMTGIALSLGALSDIEGYVSQALEAPVAEVQAALREADVVNHDETGWREANEKAWLWTTVTANYAVYKIDLKRSGEVARSLCGGADFNGYVGSDRFKAYNVYPMERRGICHSHLKRDYQKIADRPGPGQAIGEKLCAQEEAVFEVWHQFKFGEITRAQLQTQIDPIAEKIGKLLVKASVCGDAKVEGMCNDILEHWDAMWAFTYVPGLEPTNNVAEQALRPYVLWRKGCFGTQSERGSRFAERVMTVIQTCRRQGRDLLSFLVQAMEHWHCGGPKPSLIATG